MIKCKYDTNDGKHRLRIWGHANFDSEGRDIVYAGVSAIFYSLIGALLTYSPDETYYKDESGEGEVVFSDNEENRCYIKMAMLGLSQIEARYGEYLKII